MIHRVKLYIISDVNQENSISRTIYCILLINFQKYQKIHSGIKYSISYEVQEREANTESHTAQLLRRYIPTYIPIIHSGVMKLQLPCLSRRLSCNTLHSVPYLKGAHTTPSLFVGHYSSQPPSRTCTLNRACI